jgi:uncharacterized repeat protein (TIGR03803 family)
MQGRSGLCQKIQSAVGSRMEFDKHGVSQPIIGLIQYTAAEVTSLISSTLIADTKPRQRVGPAWLACAIAAIAAVPLPAQVTETLLHSFISPPMGANPFSNLVRDSSGNLYGTTSIGGAQNAGDVYELSAAGQLTVLYSFTGGSDGSGPNAGVIRDTAGNLYGTTVNGGAYGAGVVYKLTSAGQLTVLYSFTGGPDGANPYAGVIQDSAGNLYGTTAYGGTAFRNAGSGVVYELNTAGQQTVLHTFTGGTDGASPYAGLTRDASGNVYGTTYFGGAANAGVVYEVNTSNDETVLYAFTGLTDGANPNASLFLDSSGRLYGTTFAGGAAGLGVVYKLSTAGAETVLHSFMGGTDGANPNAGLVRDSAGNFYGTTIYGGASGAGVLYKLTPAGRETVPYTFTGGTDGMGPYAGLVGDPSGNLYGTAAYGGAAGLGVVFELSPAGDQTVLYGFPRTLGGYGPNSGVSIDSSGNLYGTTPLGGASGAGVVYEISGGHETVLYTFTGGADGNQPNAGVIRDSSGNLYGTTFNGGASGYGAVYEVDAAGSETVLYSFIGGPDGSNPYAGVVRDSSGNLYGTTWYGGTEDAGVIYKVNTSGQETVLYNFTGPTGSSRSYSALFLDSSGNLYGTEYAGGSAGFGAVYELPAGGQFTVLYNFTGGTDGRYPYAGVVRDTAGDIYGTTEAGGAYSGGVVYMLTPGGSETVLHSFTGGSDGDFPNAGLIRDASDNFYGTTAYGGASGFGVVYELDAANHLKVLHTFTGAPDGANPQSGVIRDSSGDLYGTTQSGGKGNVGAVFKITGMAAQ